MKVNVYGSSYFAWVAAVKLAEKGSRVDIFTSAADAKISGFYPEREFRLSELRDEQVASGRLQILDETADTNPADLHLVAYDHAEINLAELVFPLLKSNSVDVFLLVLTPVPVGGIAGFVRSIRDRSISENNDWKIHTAVLPLFTREGSALGDFEKPRLFLLGSDDDEITGRVSQLMRPFMRQSSEVMIVPVATAELIRFGINAMLATRMSFMNEMAALAEKLGVDIELVRQGMAADPRVGRDYLQPGCGFGGPTFASELFGFARTFRENLDAVGLIDTVLNINESQSEIIFRKMWRYFHGSMGTRRVAIWGAAFKPGTSSVRNSVVHPLLKALWGQGCHTVVYDPQAMEEMRRQYPDEQLISYADSAAASVIGVDAIALVTAWDEFWSPDFLEMAGNMKSAVMFDGRNLYESDEMVENGFRYFGIGHGESI